MTSKGKKRRRFKLNFLSFPSLLLFLYFSSSFPLFFSSSLLFSILYFAIIALTKLKAKYCTNTRVVRVCTQALPIHYDRISDLHLTECCGQGGGNDRRNAATCTRFVLISEIRLPWKFKPLPTVTIVFACHHSCRAGRIMSIQHTSLNLPRLKPLFSPSSDVLRSETYRADILKSGPSENTTFWFPRGRWQRTHGPALVRQNCPFRLAVMDAAKSLAEEVVWV
jgi:hypothetical protein